MENLTIYSNPIPLFYHRRKKYVNIFDYILTFITIIITIILSGFYYLQLIKKEPYLYYQTDKIDNNGNYTFSNLPFFISVVYYHRLLFIDPYSFFIPHLSFNIGSENENIPLRYCNESELNEVGKIINSNQNLSNLFICPDFKGKEYILKATKSSIRTGNAFFEFNLFKNPNKIRDDYELYELYVIWQDNYLDASDYDNPIKKDGKARYFSLRNERLEVYNLFFNIKYFESNKGYFIQNKTKTSYLNYDSIEYSSTSNKNLDPVFYYQLITLKIYLNTKVHTDSISYMKFTDILTKIVSILSTIVKFISLIGKYFRNKIMIIDLANYVGNMKSNINEGNKNEKFDSNEIKIEKKKIFKLNVIEYLLPSFLLKKNSNIKLFKEYKKYIESIISLETLINCYLHNNPNSNDYNINDISLNTVNQITPFCEQDSELDFHFLKN